MSTEKTRLKNAGEDEETGSTCTAQTPLTPDQEHADGTPRVVFYDETPATNGVQLNGDVTHRQNGDVPFDNNLHNTASPTSLLGVELTNCNRSLQSSRSSVDYIGTDFGAGSGDDLGEAALIYSKHEKIPMKDFAAEIRASKDVEKYLNKAVLLLDVPETNVDSILDVMLQAIIQSIDEPNCSVDQAKRVIYTHDTVHKLAKTIQGTAHTNNGGYDYDQSWLTIMCALPAMQKRHVAIARLKHPTNLGRTVQDVNFIILVVAPTKEKGTKNALETGRTFSTIFSNVDLRHDLLNCHTDEEFKRILWKHTQSLAEEQEHPGRNRKFSLGESQYKEMNGKEDEGCCLGRGLRNDFRRRIAHYGSDFTDGFTGPHTLHKTVSTTFFLYFSIILPSIALGMLNDNNTHGDLNVQKVMYTQVIGGMAFALFSGQCMTIVMTTAPLAIYSKVIYTLAHDWEVDFFAMYAMVGLWNMFFLIVYAVTDLSKIMKWSTRSTEEIFALFISVAFTVDSVKDVYHDFEVNYATPACNHASADNSSLISTTLTTVASVLENASAQVSEHAEVTPCQPANSLLFLLLMLGTVWVGCSLLNFTKTPYLTQTKREMLSDYALPVAVLLMSFFGSFVFKQIEMTPFNYEDKGIFTIPNLASMNTVGPHLGALGLGFCLSMLFFMDQNISSSMVNAPANKLKKGPAYHWDVLVIGLINGGLAFFGLPMLHGALPHSPLHARAMADMEEYVESGHVYQKVAHARETRVTTIISHIMIGLSILMLPSPLEYIPRAVLDGLFLFLAVTALGGIQMFERILLLFTEQAAYPPHHYVRQVPQRDVHLFTLTQFIQLLIMCAFGFSPIPYMKMCFPLLLLILLVIRHKFVTLFIKKEYLNTLDAH